MTYGPFEPKYEVFMFEESTLQNHLNEVFQKEYSELAALSTLKLDYAGDEGENRRIRCSLTAEQEEQLEELLYQTEFMDKVYDEFDEYRFAEKLLCTLFGEKVTGFFDEIEGEYAIYKKRLQNTPSSAKQGGDEWRDYI